MDSIKGHPEHVETVFGEAIVARDESLVVLAGASGLGPPDLCWLQKAPKSVLTGSSGQAKGYYHSCLGVDASSSAAVAAYFATLTSLVEPPTFLQGLFSTSEVHIERGFYCCYDPLARLDVRCELCIPGGVVCGALDCEGNVHDVTPELWRNCVVASFLRAELYDAELVSHSSVPVARYPPIPNSADEVRLLEAVTGLYEDMVLPEALEALTVDQSGGIAPEHADVVLYTLLHYFSKRQHWGTAFKFFTRLARVYPTAALYVAAVQRECGLYDEAMATLTRAVEEAPDDPVLLAGLATECLYADKVDAALRLATKSAHFRPQLRPAWLVLSRAHVRRGAGAAALVVLNLVPPPPLPGKEGAMLHVVVPPDPKSVTKPAVQPYDLDIFAVRQVLAEEAIVNSSGPATSRAPDTPGAALPGCLLVPREPLDGGTVPDTAPLRITKAVLAAVYTVLQELVAVSGWDGFLRLRSSVFVMHTDSDLLRQQQREAEERERQLQLLHRQLSATLPPSPSWVPPQPPFDVPPPEPEAGRRDALEGVEFRAALDEAAMMELAEYPEHLEDAYKDPRVAFAREAHRRHLREIAERQARLEAAEGGTYADDEWDGSSGGSASGGPDEGVGSGGGGGAGRPRSPTGRPVRGRHKGRTPSAKHQRTSRMTPKSSGRQQPEQQSQGASKEEHVEGGEEGWAKGRPASSATAAMEDAFSLDNGIVDAGEVVRQEAANALLLAHSHALKSAAEAPSALGEQQQQQAMGEAWDRGSGTPPKIVNATACPPTAPTSWWGELFGHGGGGTAPQRREAAPLGEAMERRTVGDRREYRIAKARCTMAAGLPCADCPPLPCSAAVGSLSGGTGLGGGGMIPPDNRRAAWRCEEGCFQRAGCHGRPAAAGSSGGRWDLVKAAVATEAHAVVCTELAPLVQMRPGMCHGGAVSSQGGPCGLNLIANRQLLAATVAGGTANTAAPTGSATISAEMAVAVGTPRMLACWGKSRRTVAKADLGGGGDGGSSSDCINVRTSRRRHELGRRLWRKWQRCWRLSPPQKLAMPYGPRAPMLTALCWSREVGGTARVGCTRSSGSIWQRHGIQHTTGAGPGPVAESGADAAVSSVTQTFNLNHSTSDAAALSPSGGPAASKLSAFGKAAVNASAASSGAANHRPSADGAADDDGYPLVLHNHDADRQMVQQGLDVTELGTKRLCVRWLDELIVALWHDLQAFLDWKALDLELVEAGFRTHAEIVGGVAPAPTADDYQLQAGAAPAGANTISADAAAAHGAEDPISTPPPLPRSPPHLPSVPCTEWLRRGLLAERLHHELDALAAYQAAVMTPPVAAYGGGETGGAVFAALPGGGPGAFSMIAWQAIMRLAPVAEPRHVSWALRGAQAVMTWLETRRVSGVVPSAGAATVPLTTGFVAALMTGTAGGGAGAAAAGFAAPAAAAALTAGAKLQACPLSVVHCLHLIAAVLGESAVEETLILQNGSSLRAGAWGEANMAKGVVAMDVLGAAAAVPTPLHPVIATVIRHAVRASASQPELGMGAATS
ncbi:hypothetical protein VaNZ11_016611 [Volvox africanus]|uniref:Uncharacterized protein n=1 Tax=Volvox africanus TaxID=51714 RepID=A0ABQ5SPY5_9CHLO|nr:hypothetical protein VaNZ11_016611 [Volvox africanus]